MTTSTHITDSQRTSQAADSFGSPLDCAATSSLAAIIAMADSSAARLPDPSPSPNPAAAVDTAEVWAADLAHESLLAKCTTIGLISGSRHATPRCVIDGYARLLADALAAHRCRRPMLIVRLTGRPASASRRASQIADATFHITASPLGPWSEVTIAVAAGKQTLQVLESLSYVLPKWKREFGFVMVDLGPIAEVPSRLIGSHCDSCFVLLGPESCGSYEWLLQNIAWHACSGSTICGTLVTELQ